MNNHDSTTSSQNLTGADAAQIIPDSTPLTRLNYFDGKFLRAADLELEQKYSRTLIGLANQSLGAGVVYGFDTALGSSGALQIGAGLAVDREGRSLLLPQAAEVSLSALFAAATGPANASSSSGGDAGTFMPCAVGDGAETGETATGELWIVSIALAEALRGREDVYGRLCELACVTSTERPYKREGLIVRASRLKLVTPLPTSSAVSIDDAKYLRARAAHAYFEDERLRHPSAIGPGLNSELWCHGSSFENDYADVPLALIAREGFTTRFLDPWTVRRERMDTPARSYWQWRTMLRPWAVFSAQVLQFQCQLRDALAMAEASPTQLQSSKLLGEAADTITELRSFYREVAARLAEAPPGAKAVPAMNFDAHVQKLDALAGKLAGAKTSFDMFPTARILIEQGITHLPPAGFTPVDPNGLPIETQVRALLGDGLDLRFCAARPDYIAGAFEEAQHLERISLLDGIGVSNKPEVDIFVPDGVVIAESAGTPGVGFKVDVSVPFDVQGAAKKPELQLSGAARLEPRPNGALKLYAAVGFESMDLPKLRGKGKAPAEPPQTFQQTSNLAAWLELTFDANPLDNAAPTTIGARVNAYLASPETARSFYHLSADGELRDIARGTEVTAVLKATPQITDATEHSLFQEALPNIELKLDTTTSPAVLTVVSKGEDHFTVTLEVDWSEYPSTELRLFLGDQLDTPVGTADAVAGPDVFRSNEEHHVTACSAIELIASDADPFEYDRFGKSKPRLLLFPRDESSTSQRSLIQGVHDWVMFRRRREKVCAPVIAPSVTQAEVYRIFMLLSLTERGEASLKNATSLGTVAFDSDSATVLTSTGDVQAIWSPTEAFDLVGVQVASTRDDEVLQRARFNRFAAAVGAAVPLKNLKVQTSTKLPDELGPTDVQGVIVAVLAQKEGNDG